jgi:flagellar biosynthesis/type III secretory pathway protein FliH
MKAEKTVYKISRSYKKFARKMAERKNMMDRAERELEIREAAIAEGLAEGRAEGRTEGLEQGRNERSQYFLDLLNQGLTIEEIKQRLS